RAGGDPVSGLVSAPASEIGTVTWTITNGTRRPQLAVDLGPDSTAAHLLFDEPESLREFILQISGAWQEFTDAVTAHETAVAVAEHARRLPDPPGPAADPVRMDPAGPGATIADDTPCVHCGENTRPRVADGPGGRCVGPVECG